MASQFPVSFAGPRDMRRVDPFEDFTQEVNRLFGSFFPVAGSLMGLPARAADAVALPRLDIREDEQGLCVSAELPGVDAADVDVRIEGDTLLISGEKKAAQPIQTSSYHVMERSFGHFKRAISLPFTPDPQAVDASFDLGVLTVHVPRQATRQISRRIEVRQGAGIQPDTYLNDEQRMPAGPGGQTKAGEEPAH